MPLPTNLSPWEHFQAVVTKIHNYTVRQWFREDIPEDSINTTESALKYACLMKDDDNGLLLIGRFLLFWFYSGYLFQKISEYCYIIPKHNFHDSVAFFPQIQFYFIESYKRQEGSNNSRPKDLTISIRWFINPDSVSTTHINTLRSKINTEFSLTYEFYCGIDLYIYDDKDNQIKMLIPGNSESDVSILIRHILDVVKSVPNDRGYSYTYNPICLKKVDRKSTKRNETITIAGDTVKKYRNTKTGYVKLKNAKLEINNWFGDNILCERGRG